MAYKKYSALNRGMTDVNVPIKKTARTTGTAGPSEEVGLHSDRTLAAANHASKVMIAI